MVEIEVLQPKEDRRAKDNAFVSVAQSGLRQIYCQLTVSGGTYQGVSFRQNITLPLVAQNIELTANQKKACNISGATLKAICLAAKKPPKMQDVTSLTGLRFPACLKINPSPVEKNGRVFWNNEIAHVVTPEKESYAQVWAGGEIITDGPVVGNSGNTQAGNGNASGVNDPGWDQPPASAYDDQVPF